jgi:hypothetical protein
MFKREHKIFIIKSDYGNGGGENGSWVYSPRLCLLNEFRLSPY